MRRFRTVALLARPPGLAVLHEALVGNELVALEAVFTHSNLPKAEGGGTRPELEEYRGACAENAVPLLVVDPPQSRDITPLLPSAPDLLISVSWRSLVPPQALERFARGAINLHRGALPDYAGAEPVRRAIAAGERRVAITAHHMTSVIDAGPEIARVWLDVSPPPASGSPAEHAERIKGDLVSLYAPLAKLAIRALAVRELGR